MNQAINMCITGLNNVGQGFWNYAAGIFIQSSVLIVLLLIIDFLLRKRVRAVFRYCLWMLVFIKLVMPASFTLPTGIGYWMGDYFPSEVSMAKWIPQTEEIVPKTLDIHQRSIPLEPVVTNETAVIDIYQRSIPLEPVVTNETAVIDIHQRSIPLEPVVTNETAVTGIELEPICWQGLVFLGWLVGMLVLLVLLVKRACFVRGLIAQSRPANGRLLEMLDECRCLIGIRQNIELRLTSNRLSPADCGLFKPIILMPATLLEKLSREKLKAVLIHELAHIKRGDVWVNLVQTALQIIYFYNPFVWLANAMVRRVREQAVDEMVLVTLKPETKSYSNTLIDIAEMAFWRPNFSLRLIGVVESKKALERRIKHMLNRPVPKSSKLGYPGLIAIVLIGAILLPMGSNSIAEAANTQKQSRVHSESNTIVPGVRVGDYMLGMSKDDVLRKLGEPAEIFFAGESYTLNNLPRKYYMFFGDISFRVDNDTVTGITAISPYYKFTNGLGVGDSEQTIKQAFGDDFQLREGKRADLLTYKDKGLMFEIHKKNRTVMEINVSQTTGDQGDSMKALTPSPLEPFDNVGGKDLRTCDLRNAGRILDTLEFNQETRWPRPDRLPEGFDPKALLQEGMNPGLGVRALHAEGITGAGVHVGLIDQPLLLDHPEYAGKIVSYHDAGCGPSMSSMHGPGMASQLVGSRCGTAPGAKLHVVAVPSWKGDAEYYARALDRLVTRNREVRKDQKIRVVSVSAQPSGEGSDYANQSLWDRAVQRAQANGILVLDCTWHHGFVSLCWLDPQDRESVEACTPGFRKGNVEFDKGHIHVPSAPRTVAEASDERPYGYAYDGGGRRSSRPMAKNGYSDTIPYTAGILALGWQIRPELTSEQMKEMLFASAYVHESGARIINPTAFIDLVRNQSGNQQIRTRPQTYSESQTIVPGVRVGDYTLDMSKDDVLKELGEPEAIQLGEDDVDVVRRGEERYSLNNLPRHYILSFGNISFWFKDDSIEVISVHTPLYKLSNGLGVGDSEQKLKQAFGEDFDLEEVLGKDFLCYKSRGLGFEMHKKNQTVAEIVVYEPEGDSDAPDQQEHSKYTIVPGVGVGDYTLGISKQVLNKLGQPEGMSFGMDDGIVKGITVHSPLYKFSNGLGVGDSEQEIKQAFGDDFNLKDAGGIKDFLTYKDKGLMFEIRKKNRTVMEINVYQPTGDHGDSDAPDSRKVIVLSEQPPGPITFPKIDRRPSATNYGRGKMKELPTYDADSRDTWQVDLRAYDLSALDLRNSLESLFYASFDDRTIWPSDNRMPQGFNTQRIMELGKNPGLGIRDLHSQGITGKGVGIAIIDQTMLVDHQEYRNQLRLYEETDDITGAWKRSQMHGPAVASIAVGKTVGVAPEADLYYIATARGGRGEDFSYLARSIRRILQVNEQLPKRRRIRVIAMAIGWSEEVTGYEDVTKAAQEAKAAGMLVICSSVEEVHGFGFHGLGRHPLANPDVFESYEPGLWWAKKYYDGVRWKDSDRLLVPMDSRTTASPLGNDEYVFYRQGGWSWSIPYIAGVYALAAQVEPTITPEQFWSLAMKTGNTIQLDKKDKIIPFGPIVDPVRLIRSIKAGELSNLNRKQSDNQQTRTRPRTYSETQTIVPGVRVGNYTLDMSKDDVLKELGEPEAIQLGEDEVVRRGEEKYSLNNLPREYILCFGDISFWFSGNSLEGISVRSPLYKLSNGLKVGDSEQKIKQAFGYDFRLREALGKDFLCYKAKGLGFEMHKKNQTVAEIVVYQPEGDSDAPDQQDKSTHTIVPGVGVGNYMLGMSKQVLNKMGQPEGMSFGMDDGIVKGITVHSPLYKFSNGLGVGDSEQEIKQAFGDDFNLKDAGGIKDFLTYEDKGLMFEIRKKNRTVMEINVYQPTGDHGDSDAPDRRKVIMFSEQPPGPITFPKIDRKPKPNRWERSEIKSLPKYDPALRNGFQVDLRGRDLSKLDLRNSIENLMYADFDDRTVWPASDKMPNGFTWQRFMEMGKNPGLGVRTLHERGITGKGVGIAIIDQTLLTEHIEYADSLRLYEENNIRDGTRSSMHGAAVASIAVGKTVGVAPDADLYYIATWNLTRDDNPRYNFVFRAQSIRRLLEINRQLPANRKIRVISNSVGWSPSQEGYDEITAACEEAKAAGIFVVSCGIIEPYGFDFGGLGRHPLANPHSFESYGPCLDWAKIFYNSAPGRDSDTLWVPEDSRATASFTGGDEYVFYRQGGASWCAPYIAGIYALAVQVKPDITPERFWSLAMKTGRTIELEHEGEKRSFGPIIDPVRLIRSIKAGELSNLNRKQSDNQQTRTRPQTNSKTQTIVPGLRVGDYTLGMSKDEVLNKLGEPESIFGGGGRYTLNNLPRMYFMIFDDISFEIDNDSVKGIGVHSPLYKFTNGLGVGDSEQKIKQAFGYDFNLKEFDRKDFLNYEDKGLQFEIRKKDRTVMEIGIYQSEGNRGDRDAPDQEEHSKHTIVPGVRVGDYTFDMTKDEVLRKLGEPEAIQLGEDDEVVHRGEEKYNLKNRELLMAFGDVSFWIEDDSVDMIFVRSPLYKLSNGLRVGDSEQKIKQAFGEDFKPREALGKDYLCYDARGLAFEIHKKNQTIAEIVVYHPEGDRGARHQQEQSERTKLVRQAAADGRISFKLTTPDEFKAIAGRPTREWTDDDLVCMKYPGIEVKFFGKPEIIPHTLVFVSCEGRGIDIGQDRPIVLRNEGDLDNFGSFWGYSSVDLSRLDLSKKGKLLKAMTFDSRTVWPEPDFLPPDFDPKAVMEWGKYPGLRVKQLHDRGVTGKGVHVAIIDQPLLLGHIEYRDQLVSYKEIETGNADPQMHGPPVASILVGKTCGVAPEAILHYWAEPSWKGDYKYRCIALEQIIQFNRGKEKSEQIRVVSVSKGFSQSEPNLDRWKALLEKARQSGIYIVHCGSMGFGAGCRFLKDSDNPANYRLCAFYQGGDVYRHSGTFFTPIDHRTTASEKARDAYTFWTRGGLSWGAPYYAGVVALGIQVNPNLRPDQIDKLLYDSGWDFQRGRLINPVGFVEAAQKAD